MSWVSSFGQFSGLRFGVSSFGLRVSSNAFRVSSLRLEFRISGYMFWVLGLGFEV